MQVGLGPGRIVLGGGQGMGTQLPLPQKGIAPQFLVHICCGQMAAWIKMPLGMELGLGPGNFVLDGDARPKKGAEPPKFSAHVYCDQTAGWIKMVLGMEIGLSPGDFVFILCCSTFVLIGEYVLLLGFVFPHQAKRLV